NHFKLHPEDFAIDSDETPLAVFRSLARADILIKRHAIQEFAANQVWQPVPRKICKARAWVAVSLNRLVTRHDLLSFAVDRFFVSSGVLHPPDKTAQGTVGP